MINANWHDLRESDIDVLNQEDAIFIVAPRTVSTRRLKQIIKHYLPKASIVIGISQEPYVIGFEQQPQFKMMTMETVLPFINAVDQSNSPRKLISLRYSQGSLAEIVSKIEFARVLLVNGSWKYAFHHSDASKILKEKKIAYKFISPFIDEREAQEYEQEVSKQIVPPEFDTLLSDDQMVTLADTVAKQSFDYSFQTGALLGKKAGEKYETILSGYNKVIPYQTYALHHGNSREKYESRPHDTNHYDTIHAEMMIITEALSQNISLRGTSLFVNLLPCPNCARTLSQTEIDEVVYRLDHSDGYAATLLALCGKKVRKLQ